MMADRRGRSPKRSKESRNEPRHAEHHHNQHHSHHHDDARRVRPAPTAYLSSSPSSTSSMELVDISRKYPSSRFGIRSFFTAPSERRKLRRRRSNRMFKSNNSSSSSVNSDLAYGTGYIKRPKLRRVRSRTGKEIDREKYSEREREREKDRPSGPERRGNTEAEILAVGAGLAKLAREQNKLDLKNGRNGSRSAVLGASPSGFPQPAGTRGLAPSKISHGSDTVDEDGWESASDDESDGSVDSKLAFDGQSKADWGFWGKKRQRPLSHKNTIVDPRLFGPQNSLHGFVDRPVGFGETSPWSSSSDFGPRGESFAPRPNESFSGSQASLQRVYPVQGPDPSRFEAARSSVVSGSEPYIAVRPDPVPLQHPQPYTPVSQNVYEPTYPAPSDPRGAPSSSSRTHSVGQAALVGAAGAAAIGAAAIALDRKDDRKDSRRDDDRDEGRLKRRDSDRKVSKHEHRRDRHDSPSRDDRKERHRDKERKADESRYSDEQRREKKREKRRDEVRDVDREERREKRREARREERSDVAPRPEARKDDTRPRNEAAVSTSAVVPVYQGGDRAPTSDSSHGHHRNASVPTVVTVEREPDFSRKRSSSIKDLPPISTSDYQKDYSGRDYPRDHGLHEAESIYKEAEHSTAPIAGAAIAAAAAVVTAESYRDARSDRGRDERRGRQSSDYDYDDRGRKPRDREPVKERDHVQEEADRAYREIVMARKIASQVIRSRSASPDPSVVSPYDQREVEEPPRIVTPPEMEHPKQKGPYDAPNADFNPDYILEDPRQLRTFSLPSISLDRSDPDVGFLKRDADASKPRPYLNLVHPTPIPSPAPEQQATRSEREQPESDHSERGRSRSRSRERGERRRSSVSDVVIGPKGNVISSPTSSTVSKAVTWGENETKHFDVDSDYREDHTSEIRSRDISPGVKPQSKPSGTIKSKGWGAIAAGVIGGGVAAAAATSSDSSKKANDEKQKSKADPYEYRGVVVEPESPPSKGRRRRSPPSPDSEVSSAQLSRVPGAFDDDLDFTATVAAGLQDTGFDPNIVIDDPSFRRRDSPPGTNEPGAYRTSFAETVTDLTNKPPTSSSARESSPGFVMEEIDGTPRDRRSPDLDKTPTKLSKKEQKKWDKIAKRQSMDSAPSDPAPTFEEPEPEHDTYFDAPKLSKKEQKKRDKEAKRQSIQAEDITPIVEPSISREFVEEPESYITPKKSKKKSKKGSAAFDDDTEFPSPSESREERRISIPVDAFDDVQNEDDEWNEPKKSKKKSKRDSDRYDSPARSGASEIPSEIERSFNDPTAVSLPPSTPSETSQDRDFDDSRKSRKSSARDSAIFDAYDRDDSRSVVSEATSRYDEPRKSKKKSRSSTKDDFDDTRSVVSVASAPAWDEASKKSKKKDKEKRSSGFFGMFGSKSESGAGDESPKGSKDDFEDVKKKSKKSKRSSLPADSSGIYGGMGSASTSDLSRSVSSGHHSHRYDDDHDDGGRSDTERKKSRSRTGSASSKKDSFLGNAGTLGAGVGIAGAAAVAIAAQHHRQSKAARAHDEALLQDYSERNEFSSGGDEIFDPEIAERDFRPSIDPQYGDLLPLPPSDPVTPNVEPLEDLPDLPESRPDTPEAERLAKERTRSTFRKNLQETPIKSPSQSAVPLKFIMGNRSTPSSPGLVRSSPMPSPATPNPDSLMFPKSNRSRPTSWENGKEYRPLWLPESSRRGPTDVNEPEDPLPALPPSKSTSRSSSQLDLDDLSHARDFDQSHPDYHQSEGLFIDTGLASSREPTGLLDSQQSTPKANVSFNDFEQRDLSSNESEYADALSLPAHSPSRPSSPILDRKTETTSDLSSKAIAGVALASAIGYVASSRSTNEADQRDSTPLQQQPAPADPMSKDRSSYLLRSSPMSQAYGSTNPEQHDVDSPSRRKQSRTDGDILHSIQEPEASASLEQEFDLPADDLKKDRERTLRALSGSSYDEHPDEEITGRELGEQLISDMSRQAETEPADEFVQKKSKKDKKKRKSLLLSSTPDDPVLPEPINDAPQEAISQAADAEPDDEFALPKSKKDKKKDKKKNKSVALDFDEDEKPLHQLEEPVIDADRSVPEPLEATPEEFATPSKKSKKKDKKGKSKIAWDAEPEEDTTAQAPEESTPETMQETVAEMPTSTEPEVAEDTSFVVSKKDKKKGKKGKSKMIWEPEPEQEGESQMPEEPTQGAATEVPAYAEPEAVDEPSFSMSKKDKKKAKKGKSKISWEPEPEEGASQIADEPMPELTLDVSAKQAPTESETVDEKSVESKVDREPIEKDIPQATQDVTDLSTPIEAESLDEFAFKSKKDKKKSKNKAKATPAFDIDTKDSPSEPPQEPSLEPSLEDLEQTPLALEEDVQEQEFSLKPKKGKKKDKKKGKSALAWEPENAEPESSSSKEIADPAAEKTLVEESPAIPTEFEPSESAPSDMATPGAEADEATPREISPSDGFDSFEPKKGKKKNKRKSAQVFEPWEDTDTPKSASADSKLDVNRETPVEQPHDQAQEDGHQDTFVDAVEEHPQNLPGDKSLADVEELPWNMNEQISKDSPSDVVGELPEESSTLESLPVQESKKSKKKKGKAAMKWEPEEEVTEAPQPAEADDFQEFTMPGSKKGKKKGKKSQSFTPEETFASKPSIEDPAEAIIEPTEPKGTADEMIAPGKIAEEDFEAFSTPTSKKSKKKSKKSKPYDVETEVEPPSDTEARDLEPTSAPEGADSLPSRTAVFSAAATATGAILLAAHKSKEGHLGTGSTHDGSYTTEPFDIDGSRSTERQTSTEPSKPDGLAAGYDNDQLSLARQLQEEFGSGSKKSKKDKKKRQSMPATPNPEGSRSRQVDEDEPTDFHPRARSLSTGPATEGSAPKNIYSEDQLELARQLKADFEKGSKKSKKGKKNRQEFSEPSPWDDASPDQYMEEAADKGTETAAPNLDLPASTPTVDGFAAGYQEDQLSLARQLQAEFGKKSKKDKKDKKRRSTSQTPQADESHNDYFGDTSQAVGADEPPYEDPAGLQEPRANEGEMARDGLAAGYKEDQLELARQLKEEFGSGSSSKKSKKDKKGKKAEKLQRSSTYDDSFPGTPTGEFQEPLNDSISQLQPGPVEESATAPADAEPENEFGFSTKKSKKDKKGKKRQSLAFTTTDDDFASLSPSVPAEEPVDNDTPQSGSAAITAEQEDEFTLPVKKSKKDKKSKKRDMALTSIDDDISPETVGDSTSTLQPDVLQQPREPEAASMEPTLDSEVLPESERTPLISEPTSEAAEPNDYPEFSTKKSKKDKKGKKRQSVYGAGDEATPSSTQDTEADIASRDVDTPQAEISQPSTEAVAADSIEDVEFTTKKSKKDKKGKKRDSLRSASDEIAPVPQDTPEAEAEATRDIDISQPDAIPAASEPAIAEPVDDFEFTMKKSKKDKKAKKRESLRGAGDETVTPDAEAKDTGNVDVSEPKATQSSDEAATIEPVDDFEFTTKKSKKDKKNKKRGSLLPATVIEDDSFTGDHKEIDDSVDPAIPLELSPTAQEEPESTPAEDEFALPAKKSKKDKKKRQSVAFQEDSAPTAPLQEERANTPPLPSEDPSTSDTPAAGLSTDPVDDSPETFTMTSKKSKKDKKKRQSLVLASTFDSLPESAIEESSASQEINTDVDAVTPQSEPEHEFQLSKKQSKKDKKKRQSMQEAWTPDENAEDLDKPSITQPEQDSSQAAPRNLSEPTLDMEDAATHDTISRDLVADEDANLPQTSSEPLKEAPTETPGDDFESFPSKKDKKKRKGSSKPDLEQPSGVSTSVGSPDEPKNEPLESSLPVEGVPGDASVAELGEPITALDAEGTGDWDAFTTKKSKKDKKKRRNMTSDSVEPPAIPTSSDAIPDTLADVAEPSPLSEILPGGAIEETRDLQIDDRAPSTTKDTTAEPVQDDWDFLPSKKSKKDKKKRASGISTPIENIPEPSPPAEEPVDMEASSSAVIPEDNAEAPVDDWAPIPSKKSKKDKKKRISGISTPIEDLPEPNPAAEDPIDLETSAAPVPEDSAEAPVDDWASIPSKKSKKDKKKRTSGISTLIEDIPEPSPTTEEPVDLEASTAIPEDSAEAPVDEWASLPSKKSKKDKKKRASVVESIPEMASPAEEPLDVEASSSADIPKDAIEELVQDEWASMPSKKSKKDKKRASMIESTPEMDVVAKEPVGVEASSSATDPKGAEVVPETEDSSTPMFQDTVQESGADEWSFSSKVSKKDKKKLKSGVSTPIESILEEAKALEEPVNVTEPSSAITAEDLAQEHTQIEDPGPEASLESTKDAADDEWAVPMKKSKKDKKKRKSGVSTPVESVPEETKASEDFTGALEPSPTTATVDPVEEPIHVEDPPTADTQEPVREAEDDEWAVPSKKSKKDKKKRKSGVSTPLESTPEETKALKDSIDASGPPPAITTTALVEEPVQIEDSLTSNPQKAAEEIREPDEWVSKKSKKDAKRKSQTATPVESAPEYPEALEGSMEPKEPPTVAATEKALESPPTIDSSTAPVTEQLPRDIGDDDWAAIPLKKSKKDKKKRKSGLSTPVEIPEESTPLEEETDKGTPTIISQDATIEPLERTDDATVEPVQEPVDEWSSTSTKKSKKDKKNKSGISTPIEEVADKTRLSDEPDIELSQPSPEKEAPPSHTAEQVVEDAPQLKETTPAGVTNTPLKEPSITLDPRETHDGEPSQLEEPEDEWASFSTKKSKKGKKDKKNKKSGLSSPTDEVLEKTIVAEESSDVPSALESRADVAGDSLKPSFISTSIEEDSHKSRAIGEDSTTLEQLPSTVPDQGVVPQDTSQDTEWAPISSRKTKKDKKNRKSGLSTPVEVEAPASPSGIQTAQTEVPDHPIPQPLSTEAPQPPSIFEASPKNEEETSQEAADDGFGFVAKKSKKDKKKEKRASRTGSVDQVEDASLSGNLAAAPSNADIEIPIVPERDAPGNATASKNLAFDSKLTDPVEAPEVNDDELFTSGISRKSSKKDKRKRQATVDLVATSEAESANPPLTSWAYEVEEAEVERNLPIIEDIAKDGSLSHIASTTEAVPVDDFVRPTKKGKKGTKRNSALLESGDPSRAPTGSSPSTKPSNDGILPALATTGAILAAATLRHSSDEAQSISQGPASSTSKALEPVEEPEKSTPTRKLSKKEKRKMSIDRRVPKDDMFDDPALWEGADPKEFEETRDAQDDSGDGFWSAPDQDNKPDAPKDIQHEPTRSTESTIHPHEELLRRTSPAPEARAIMPQHTRELDPTYSHATITSLPDASSLKTYATEASPIGEASTASNQHISSPSSLAKRNIPEDPDFEDTPVSRNLFGNSKFGRTGFSDLPVVAEENPTEMEADDHLAIHSHDKYGPNRDSAFVTESPIPDQGAFTSDRDYVRDSGVHLRDVSPPDRSPTHASATDAAIANLSWPSVDEESETVDLHKLQRPAAKGPVKQSRHESAERAERERHELPRPRGDDVADFFRVEPAHKATPVKQHHEDGSSLDLLPSQRVKHEHHPDLHRTSATYKPARDKPRKHDEERTLSHDPLPSQRAKEEKHVDPHRSQTIHRSADDSPSSHNSAKVTSRGFTPPLREKSDRITEIHRNDSSHDSPKAAQENLFKQRLQRFESPEAYKAAKPREDINVKQRVQRIQSPSIQDPARPREEKYGDLNRSQTPKAERPAAFKDDNTIAGAAALAGVATLGFAAARQLSQEKRPSSGQSQRSFSPNINRLRTPDPKLRPDSVTGSRSGTPPLRRTDRKISGDLRSLSQRSHVDIAKEAELAAVTSAVSTSNPGTTATPNPTANEGRVRTKDMADVYDGFGEGRIGSPRSPTRPHSMRRRQSMQVLDLESKVEQLAAENRVLAEAKAQAEQTLQSSHHNSSSLIEKDAEIDSLKRTLDWLQNEVTKLTEVNEGLKSANVTLGNQQNERYGILESQHMQSTRELQEIRDAHGSLSTGMDGIVIAKVQAAVQDKDQEIAQLRAELESAKEKIRQMQRQILLSKTNDVDFLTIRDEDYFDNACQQLCHHVQQWVLRFSKFSDMRACRLTSEINNDKTIDRLDNAILDGSDVDNYLADRIKRRDVFMSMTMTMVWEFIFTRYLFGMDREQRQKLKSLEKLLSEVGPQAAVHHWRATTLTLLSKRESFVQQRGQDTQAVVHAILETLSEILPPPSHLEDQIEEQLQRVIKAAVDLSIEMRTQRAEYMMLPPLQPEYDANGDLASKVSFNAALMNERSGDTTSNEELEDQNAVVRIVLFPLVVKKGDDRGDGDEEIVVCPAQVLVAKPKKSVRVFSPEDMAHQNSSRISMQSAMPADYGERDDSVV